MKIALASVRIRDRDIKYNLSQMERCMVEARKGGAELVCFGETCLQGFDALTWDFERDKNIAVSTDSDLFAEICRLSAKHGIDLLFGYVERSGDALYSACALIEAGNLLHNYRRISRGWKEYTKTDGHYREGETVEVFRYKGRRCVIGLCGDLWDFPERFALGAEVLFWPVYTCWTAEEWESRVKEEYAQQASKCCPRTLYVNALCGNDAFGGAADLESGTVRQELPMGTEGLLFVAV